MKLLKMSPPPPIKASVIALVSFATLGVLPLSADDTTATWIGGSSGAALTAANWGLEKIEDCKGYFRITNTVTFTESGSSYFWNIASLTVENRSTVTYASRYWFNTGSATEILDIGEGSEVKPTYMMGGEKTKSFYRRGAGTLTTPSVGSNGNVWKNTYFEGGLSKVSAFYVTDLIDISAPATVRLTAATGATQGNPVWNVNGLLDCNNQKIPSIAGISGSGVITNANNLTVNLLKPNQTFDGAIQGRFVIEPSADADPDAYMVIGNAQTLANAELVVRDVEGHGDPIRFAAGIGTFYVRRFDKGRAYRDTEGNPVTLVESRMHLYVDSSRQGDPGDGLSWPTAYQTLKEAMESPSIDPLGTIVHVAEGTYSNGVMESGTDVFRVVVPDNVELRSESGAEKTFIVGAESPASASYGCGPGAIRCLKMAQSSRIEGFTITGGRVTNYASGNNGGGCKGNGTMVDCVISNNVAFQGAAVECGSDSAPTTFIRCRFLQNRSSGLGSALFYSSVLYDCLFDGNLGNDTIYTGAGKVYAYNCTFGPNNANNAIRTYGQDGKLAHAYNCVFLKPVRGNNDTQTNLCLHACLMTQPPTEGALADDDCTVTNLTVAAEALAFAGLDADLRPLVHGRGRTVDSGTNAVHVLPEFEYDGWDVDKNARIQGARIDLGAVELDPTRTFVDLSVPEGGVIVEGIGLGRTEIAKGESVTITLRRTFTSDRLCTGLRINGEFVDFDDCPDGWTTTVEGVGVSAYLNVEAVYASENILYVDCGPKGDDNNKGYHPDCPRKTLAGAMTPPPPSGAIVRVAPGCYTNETMDSVETSDPTRARVVVPAGVTLESLAGADETFIVGEPSPTPDDYGCGADAVRCVFLGAGAVLRGFTCTNGFTVTGTSNNNGGGAKGGTVEDCVFTRCAAWRGGGAHGSICRRCRFVDNAAKQIGTHLNESFGAYDCVFTGAKRGGSHVTLNVAPLVNCTFYGNGAGSTWDAVNISNATVWPSSPSNVVNCVIFGYANNLPYYTSCIFDSNAANVSEENRGAGSVLLPGAGSEIGGLDAEGRPLKGSCVIDVGTNMTFAADRYGTLDAGGGQRVYNGRVDIGAYEYDWRTDFAADIARGKMKMTDASADVTESDDETVLLGNGDAVKLVWKDQGRKPTDRFFNFKVTDGTLAVRVNGEAVATFAEDGEWKYADGAATDEIEFSFEGAGRAELLRSKADIGVLLIVR